MCVHIIQKNKIITAAKILSLILSALRSKQFLSSTTIILWRETLPHTDASYAKVQYCIYHSFTKHVLTSKTVPTEVWVTDEEVRGRTAGRETGWGRRDDATTTSRVLGRGFPSRLRRRWRGVTFSGVLGGGWWLTQLISTTSQQARPLQAGGPSHCTTRHRDNRTFSLTHRQITIQSRCPSNSAVPSYYHSITFKSFIGLHTLQIMQTSSNATRLIPSCTD